MTNDRPTPETDAEHKQFAMGGFTLDFCRKLERERDEAREALADWENAAAHVEADHPDETHCGCVSVLQKLLHDARSERDEARELLASEKITRNHIIKRSVEVERERDEARIALKHIEEYGTEEINAAVELRQKLASALVERDEAREALASREVVIAQQKVITDLILERDDARKEVEYYKARYEQQKDKL